MQTFIQLFITGVTVGCIYGLIAVGFVLIYKSSQIFNFAQGEMVMVGAYLMWVVLGYFNMPVWLGMLVVFFVVSLAGYGLERFPLRQMIG
ncbi:MAG: branched-chain amino acid ABC transporter permease, partial [Deltaproteobacteria bacterium]|nr:branched-chain amino acid ABC transporter permease [Deltaproteobacteria bacterium]